MTSIDPNWTGEPHDDDIYKENIIDHYKHPRNNTVLEHADIIAAASNPLCGDNVTIYLALQDNTITNATFTGRGCAISQAAASMLTDHIQSKSLQDVTALTPHHITALLGITLSIIRMRCATLILNALHNGLSQETNHEQTRH